MNKPNRVTVEFTPSKHPYETYGEFEEALNEWVQKHAKGKWIGYRRTYQFELQSDANWFKLKWE